MNYTSEVNTKIKTTLENAPIEDTKAWVSIIVPD